MRKTWSISLLFFVQLAWYTHIVLSQGSSANPCVEQNTCGDCIQAGAMCGWCLQTNFPEKDDRCNFLEKLDALGCDYDNIVKPQNEAEYTKNLPPMNAEDGPAAIQLSPQEMNLQIRPKTPFTFNVTFRQAENYPVDLYYIMDLSHSMKDDKDKVAELGDLLSEEMVKITSNFRLGFGSFIDKKTMPYVSIVPSALEKPCKECVAPYGFKNQLSLTDDTTQFRSRVLSAEISGNLDSPEGGFDAMMQAIACEQIGWRRNSRKLMVYSTDADFHHAGDGLRDIGWREYARRMLLFSTDANFHFAGDGKLGGIVKPNDGDCHLDAAGMYSESLNQDYPSIAQISNKVADNNVNVIFAVTKDRVPVYKKLAKFIDGSVVGELAGDSSNIVKLVKENYEEISGQIELKASAPEGVRVSFKAYCLNDTVKEGSKCDKVGIGETVHYEVTVEVLECPEEEGRWQLQVEIYPVGLAEKLVIDLDMICQCECEEPGNGIPNSDLCNNKGTYECGACTCNPGLYGKKCECDGTGMNSEDYDAQCKQTNTSEVCEGHGECVCGICECGPVLTARGADPSQRWSGKFCECNNYACDYYDGKLCGGPERGVCNCGECICHIDQETGRPLYTGDNCDCATSQETCKADNGQICNGKGECICGKCRCTEDNWGGPTCSDCPTCPGQCEEKKACVQCKAFGTGEITEQDNWEQVCNDTCGHVTVKERVQEKPGWKMCQFKDDEDKCIYYFIHEYDGDLVIAQSEKDNKVWKKCRFRDEDGCFFYFSYKYTDSGDVEVEVQREKECPVAPNWWLILLIILILIVLIGLLLLCLCKFLITLYDRREYAKFEKELEKAKWDMAENPIFKPATSTYANPMKQ